MVDRSEYVHEHPIVGFLVEFGLLGAVLLVEALLDGLKDLAHELVLVEVGRLQQHHDQLDEALDVAVVEAVVGPARALVVVERLLNAGFDHHLAEGGHHCGVLEEIHLSQVVEISVNILFLVGLLSP